YRRSGGGAVPGAGPRGRTATGHRLRDDRERRGRPSVFDLVIANGRVVDGSGLPWFRADVGINGDRIAAVGTLAHAEAGRRPDATGRVAPRGSIDAQVHGDLALLADPLHEPAIRQGVTTYLVGQDGVAMAPASPATLDYMRRYTAGFSGGAEWPLDRPR